MKKKDRLPRIVSGVVMVLLLSAGLYLNSYGGSYYYQIREKFGGNTLDSGRVFLFTGADSTSNKALSLSGDATAIDSVVDSILVTDTAACRLVYKLHFFGQGAEGFSENIPPMFPRTSGDAVGIRDYTVNIKFLDTSAAPDAFVPYVNVNLRGWNTSVLLGDKRTNESGIATFGTDADSVAFMGVGPSGQYVWPTNWEDSVPNSGNLTDTVIGYFVEVPVASGAQVCAVTVIVLDNGGRPARNIPVTAYLPKSNLKDSAGYAVANYTQEKKTDSNGRATFQCRWSSYLVPATKWWFAVAAPGVGQARINITVPRQTSYTLQF